MPEVKTLKEHLEFVQEISLLSFSFAWKLQTKLPEENLSDILRLHTMLYYHILNLPTEKTRTELSACKAENAEDFEKVMWDRTKDFILDKASKFYPDSIGMPGYIKPESHWNCGSLKYDPPHLGLSGNPCVFHIANTTAPRSIFEVKGHLLECFEKLICSSEKEYGYTTLYTSTWLNDREDFLHFFPQEWRDNLSPREKRIPGWTVADWGQLLTGRGLLNKKTAAFARENGVLKYCNRSSCCSFANMKKHLEFLRQQEDQEL
jgi:hypothetical protein